MIKRINVLFFIFLSILTDANGKERNIPDVFLADYKTYALARCIRNNYEKMGVHFNDYTLKDYTMGFIDIENGFAFSTNKNNALDLFIRTETDEFYRPKKSEGDLAGLNMVIYDCIDFYHSKKLKVFLNDALSEKMKNDSE